MVVFFIAIGQKILVAGVGVENLARVLDGTEILFGTRNDLLTVGEQSHPIGTIQTINSFDDVQIGQMLVVEHDVIAAFDPGDAVNGEAAQLIKTDAQVEQIPAARSCRR